MIVCLRACVRVRVCVRMCPARNPQWTERHCSCYLAGVRLSRGVVNPEDFLKLDELPGTIGNIECA
eukprot:COSAG02_NODE_5254_length_4494_cov_2.427759_4_plen_66_part_00